MGVSNACSGGQYTRTQVVNVSEECRLIGIGMAIAVKRCDKGLSIRPPHFLKELGFFINDIICRQAEYSRVSG
ncbi:MAG: hypothetical protein ABW121_19940 [Candidatus Thiodiazotropha sp. 6PLUC7]